MKSLLRRLYQEQRGQVLYLIALAAFVILGMAALSIDIGFALHAQRELQASADASATAGALDISNDLPSSTAIATANLASGIAGGKNAYNDLPNVTMVSGFPAVTCVTSMETQYPCQNAAQANAIAVEETVQAPTFFGKMFSITSIKLTASSLALEKGGTLVPANIMMILDTTGSMSSTDTTCASVTGIRSPSRLDCSKYGARLMISQLNPCPAGLSSCGAVVSGTTNVANAVDEVGLLTFPGLVSSTDAQYDYTNCGKNMSQTYISPYAGPPTTQPPYFTIVGLSSDYKLSDSSTTLNGATSDLVDAVDWTDGNPGNCSDTQYGLQNPAGENTYYAGVITEAQSDLSALAAPRNSMQSAIIILSDGAANAPWNSAGPPTSKFTKPTPSSYGQNECAYAIKAAQAAAGTQNAIGLYTWVYSVAYGSSTATGSQSTCTTDTSGISACQTMQDMASDPTKFYSDAANGCVSPVNSSLTTLTQIFNTIPNDFKSTRLLPFSLYVPPQ